MKDVKPKKEAANNARLICKFFVKKGVCKKGKNCEFSHDVQSKKTADEASSSITKQVNKNNNNDNTSDSDSKKEENASASSGSRDGDDSDSE